MSCFRTLGIQQWHAGWFWGCSQDVILGCSHLIVWQGLKDSLPGWLNHEALAIGPLWRAAECLCSLAPSFPRASNLREQCLSWPSFKSLTLPVPQYLTGYPGQCGEDSIQVWIPESRIFRSSNICYQHILSPAAPSIFSKWIYSLN